MVPKGCLLPAPNSFFKNFWALCHAIHLFNFKRQLTNCSHWSKLKTLETHVIRSWFFQGVVSWTMLFTKQTPVIKKSLVGWLMKSINQKRHSPWSGLLERRGKGGRETRKKRTKGGKKRAQNITWSWHALVDRVRNFCFSVSTTCETL